jgi:hypothetical protein
MKGYQFRDVPAELNAGEPKANGADYIALGLGGVHDQPVDGKQDEAHHKYVNDYLKAKRG